MKVFQKVKGDNGCLCTVNSGKCWVTLLSRVTPNGTSIKVVDNLISQFEITSGATCSVFFNFIT